MIIKVDEIFKKDFKNLKNQEIQERVFKKINLIENISNIEEIPNLKKMKWFERFYRIRVWDYRLGFEFDGNKITLLRIRSRKDIYNIFP